MFRFTFFRSSCHSLVSSRTDPASSKRRFHPTGFRFFCLSLHRILTIKKHLAYENETSTYASVGTEPMACNLRAAFAPPMGRGAAVLGERNDESQHVLQLLLWRQHIQQDAGLVSHQPRTRRTGGVLRRAFGRRAHHRHRPACRTGRRAAASGFFWRYDARRRRCGGGCLPGYFHRTAHRPCRTGRQLPCGVCPHTGSLRQRPGA